MQIRSYSARRINVTEKPGRHSGISSLQSCVSQLEQNETDEPPSLSEPLNAGIGLYGLSRKNPRPFRFVNLRSLLFLSKSHMSKKRKDLFFAGLASELTTELFDAVESASHRPLIAGSFKRKVLLSGIKRDV